MARQIYNDTWASGGDIVDPGAVKTTLGWVVEAPPHEFFNFWQGQTDEMLQHIERNGISEFNAATIYDLGGYAREGTVTFRSLVAANTGNLPSTSPTEWVQAFFKTSEAAGLDVANVFTANQTIKRSSATTTLDLDADTGFDTFINFKENSVRRADMFYDESQDFFRILKRDTDGNTVKCDLQFQNDGDVDLVTGVLKVAGNLVFHQGNDGSGSGFDADTVDGIEAAAIAQLSVANVFTGSSQTLDNGTADTPNLIFNDPVNNSNASIDVAGETFRILTVFQGAAVQVPFTLNLNTKIANFTDTPTVAGNTVFHAGNDGAGSGLDADLLDGIQLTSIARTDIEEVFNNSVGIGGATPGNTFDNGKALAIGDSDTGLRQNGDGQLEVFANNVEIIRIQSTFIDLFKNTQVTGSFTINGNTFSLINTGGNAAFEIGRTNGTASTPFMDFHSGATSVDFDSRIIASGGNGTNGGGTLDLQGNILVNGAAIAGANTSLSNLTATGNDKISSVWIVFDGTGTPSITGSFNVTSITDTAVGDYTINLTTSLADANYAVGLGGGGIAPRMSVSSRAVGSFRYRSFNTSDVLVDRANNSAVVHGGQ